MSVLSAFSEADGKSAITSWPFFKVKRIIRVKVFSPNRDRKISFAEEMSKSLNIEVIPVDAPKEVVQRSDIIVTATNSNETGEASIDFVQGFSHRNLAAFFDHLETLSRLPLYNVLWKAAHIGFWLSDDSVVSKHP